MWDDSVEQFWYIFWLMKAILSLCFFAAVILICTSVFGLIRSKRVKRRSFKHPAVHPLGIPAPPRNFGASQSEAIGRIPSERKKRVG